MSDFRLSAARYPWLFVVGLAGETVVRGGEDFGDQAADVAALRGVEGAAPVAYP
jgi:hypothetical protein